MHGKVAASKNMTMMEMEKSMNPAFETANYGGTFVNTGIGTNIYIPTGKLKNVRLGLEYALPIYQKVNGFQLKRKGNFVVGLQYSL